MTPFDLEPHPGEVWIATQTKIKVGDNEYGIGWPTDRPFIVTYISSSQIGFIADDGTPEGGSRGQKGSWNRSRFVWHEHMARIWPPPPDWTELQDAAPPAQAALLAPDDLRANGHA